MRYLVMVLILALTACVEDATPSETGDPIGGMDTGTPGSSDGSLEEGDACLTDDWFCVEGAPDAGPTVNSDGAKPPGAGDKDAGKGNKPPMGDLRETLVQKKQTGWYGVVNDERSIYGYLGFARGVLTCDVVYRWFDLEMVDGCAECTFAQSGTLGAPAIEKDTACGDALTMEGETVAFGHGLQAAPFPGYFQLYRRQEGAWSQAGYSSDDATEGWSFFTTEGEMEMPDPGGDEAKGSGWDVQLNRETGEGEYAYQARDEEGALTCDLFFPISGAVANETCDTCVFAYDLPLGNRQIRIDGPACANAYDLSGLTPTAGHADPSTLLFLKNGRWSAVPGANSGVDGTVWRFTMDDA